MSSIPSSPSSPPIPSNQQDDALNFLINQFNLSSLGQYNSIADPNISIETPSSPPPHDNLDSEVLIGSFNSKIVGVRYYNGIVSLGEQVNYNREPTNPYDGNAIRVDNIIGDQIGHIPRDNAATLAPLLDQGFIRLDIVTIGRKGTYDVPVKITIYSPNTIAAQEAIPYLRNLHISQLEQESRDQRESEEWTHLLSNLENASLEKKAKIMDNLGIPTQDLAKMPKASQPTKIKTPMLGYQLQGLQWMIDAENVKPPEKGQTKLFWHFDGKVYQQHTSRYTQSNPPVMMKGGILADDMGLGKSIQTLALICSETNLKRKPTLILAPLSVLGNWSGQIEQHVKPDTLKYHVYHGEDKISKKELEEMDVVISTYNSLTGKDKTLNKISWKRVVLDEGHQIRNPKTKINEACTNLDVESRWILSGTPIQNNITDLYGLLKFLHMTPYNDSNLFKKFIERPIKKGYGGYDLLKLLISAICLRRHKSMEFDGRPIVNLPPCNTYLHRIELDQEERQVYDGLQSEARELFLKMRQEGMGNYNQMLELLTRLRQTCNHVKLLGERQVFYLGQLVTGTMDNINWNDPDKRKLIQHLKANESEDCCICLEMIRNVTITPCGHFFCLGCIRQVVQNKPSCPLCRQKVELKQLLTPPPEVLNPSENDNVDDVEVVEEKEEVVKPSTKITILLKFLKLSLEKDDSTKSIVFSQWSSMLDLIEPHLKSNKISFVRFDGSMSRKKREDSIKRFTKGSSQVFLATLKAGGLGLNLTAANCVYLVDSWWNPSLEDQAIDRCYRLGQTRKVNVFRLIANNTIEEKVLELQEKKKRLVKEAFGERAGEDKKAAVARMEDLAFLLGEKEDDIGNGDGLIQTRITDHVVRQVPRENVVQNVTNTPRQNVSTTPVREVIMLDDEEQIPIRRPIRPNRRRRESSEEEAISTDSEKQPPSKKGRKKKVQSSDDYQASD